MAWYHVTTHTFFVPFFHIIIFPLTATMLLPIRGWIQVTQELTWVSFCLVELCTSINIIRIYDKPYENRDLNTEWPQHNTQHANRKPYTVTQVQSVATIQQECS